MTQRRVLVFHHAAGFVHRSIPDAVAAIQRLGAARGFAVDATAGPERFAGGRLGEFGALVFVHTSGNVLPRPEQRAALERYMRDGGGFLGIHAASSMHADVRSDWPWFRDLIGASFTGHTVARLYSDRPIAERTGVVYGGPLAAAPPDADVLSPGLAMASCEDAVVRVEDPACAAVRGIGDGVVRRDEWYGFDENPRPRVHIAATVDEATYQPYLGAMGDDHPIVWWREFGGGRSVYNSMGHAAATWSDPAFLESIAGGIELAAGWPQSAG